MDNYEILCGIALNAIFGYEPAAARALIKRFGSPGAVFSQSPATLDEVIGPYNKYRPLICRAAVDAAHAEWERLQPLGCSFIGIDNPAYPPLLADCPDAPVGLYIRSRTPPETLFSGRESVSIVGTRDISPYGKEWTEKIVGALSRAERKPVIVSGFAMGVDITAHLAALAFGLPTIAVLPVGPDDIYPRRHRTVAAKMLDTEGCALVTDFPPGTIPAPFNFLRRNRIIAGLSRATILAESKTKGGGTMTARLASGYGREVFCLPGRIDDLRSGGCNLLIAEKLAEPITDISALGPLMGLGSTRREKAIPLEERLRKAYGAAPESVRNDIIRVAMYINGHRGTTPDEICRELDLGSGEVAAALCLLESDGFVYTDLLRRCCIDNKKV